MLAIGLFLTLGVMVPAFAPWIISYAGLLGLILMLLILAYALTGAVMRSPEAFMLIWKLLPYMVYFCGLNNFGAAYAAHSDATLFPLYAMGVAYLMLAYQTYRKCFT